MAVEDLIDRAGVPRASTDWLSDLEESCGLATLTGVAALVAGVMARILDPSGQADLRYLIDAAFSK